MTKASIKAGVMAIPQIDQLDSSTSLLGQLRVAELVIGGVGCLVALAEGEVGLSIGIVAGGEMVKLPSTQ